MILGADIGGTKVHLALAGATEPARRVRERMVPTADIRSPVAAITDFAASSPEPLRAAVLGVAGPVIDNVVRNGANLPWEVNGTELSEALGAPVCVLNDLEAAALGVESLREGELATLQSGTPRAGPRVLVAPGTGLGESVALRRGGEWMALAGEGAHADFAPRTDEEFALLRWLRDRFGRGSWEHVVSGPGLVNVFCWLRDEERVPDDSTLTASPGDGSAAPAIGQAALAGSSRICVEAVRVWVRCFAAEAGNQALRVVATGGVYLGGGIPAKLLPALRAEEFLRVFRSKAPHEELLRSVPVHVILAPDVALRGALDRAATLARSGAGVG